MLLTVVAVFVVTYLEEGMRSSWPRCSLLKELHRVPYSEQEQGMFCSGSAYIGLAEWKWPRGGIGGGSMAVELDQHMKTLDGSGSGSL